jgi:hypothetical protein
MSKRPRAGFLSTPLIAGFLALASVAVPGAAQAQACLFADGTLVKEQFSAPVWVIQKCVKFWVPDATELYALGGWGNVIVVPDGLLSLIPNIPPDNMMVVERGFNDVHVIIAGASYYALDDAVMFAQLGGWPNVTVIPRNSMWWVPPGSGLTPVSWYPRSGAMIKERSKAEVWVVYNNVGYWVSDPDEVRALGGWGNVHVIPDQRSAPFWRCPADGTLLRERTQAPVWVVYGCTRYWVPNETELGYLGGWSQVLVVPTRSVTQNPPAYWPPVNSFPTETIVVRERFGGEYLLFGGACMWIPSFDPGRQGTYPGLYPLPRYTLPHGFFGGVGPGIQQYPFVPRDGTVVHWSDEAPGTAYLLSGGLRYPISNPNDCPNQITTVPIPTTRYPIATESRQLTCPDPGIG